MLHAIILAGGSGTRLWPESRQARPKQFLPLLSEQSLLESTLARLDGLNHTLDVRILTGQTLVATIENLLPRFPKQNLWAEPVARNTAPCLGWAAVKLLHDDPEAVMIVVPSDAVVSSDTAFCDTIRLAAEMVHDNPANLVLIGVTPTFPATSYGYIQYDKPLYDKSSSSKAARLVLPQTGFSANAFTVTAFHEKPKRKQAEEWLTQGNVLWNAGIFVWHAKTFLNLLRQFEPELAACLDNLAASLGTNEEDSVTEKEFLNMKSISVDYAVLEKATNLVTIEASFAWDDLGTWRALERILSDQNDAAGNVLSRREGARGKLLPLNSSGCIVRDCTASEHNANHLFAIVDVKDLIVVHTEDATLIANKNNEEALRQITEELKTRNWNEYL